MKTENHIIALLESLPLRALNDSQRAGIEEHAATCPSCRRAYEAAQVSAKLLEARAKETVEPPLFFETRVLAHVRELRTSGSGLLRLWRAAGALCSSMAATVVVLGILTFALPAEQTEDNITATRVSAEAVILNQTEIGEELASDGQVLRTLYAVEEDAIK